MWNRLTIIEMIADAADRFEANDQQQLKQLSFACEQAPDRELFFGLFSFFYDPSLQDNSIARQQLAGAILFRLSPSCPLELDGFIYALPKYWELSIEEIPWYLCKVFGKQKVIAFLEDLIPDVEDEKLKQSFKTLLLLANGYKVDIT